MASFCARCGASAGFSGARFCANCGSSMTGDAAVTTWNRLAGVGNIRAFFVAVTLVVGIAVALVVYGLSTADDAAAGGSGSPTEEQLRDPDNYLLRCVEAAAGDQELIEFCSRLVPR